jgi:hypothetical protein
LYPLHSFMIYFNKEYIPWKFIKIFSFYVPYAELDIKFNLEKKHLQKYVYMFW